MRRASLVLATVTLLGSLLGGRIAVAEGASPVAEQETSWDLAAMALAPKDLPVGFFEDYSEWLLSSAAFSELVLGGEPVPAGLQQVYQSFSFNNDDQVAVHNYLFTFTSPDAAPAGMGIVDAKVLRPPLPDGTVDGPTTIAGKVIGDGPSTITHISYDTRGEGGPLVDVVATTIRHENLVAGISIERYTDGPTAVTPVAATQDSIQADADLGMTLATRLEERIATVMSGETPTGVDFALSAMVLPLDQLAVAGTPVFGGYKLGVDLLRCGICGEENSLLPFADDALVGISRTLSVGPLVDGEPTPPFVSVAITPFTSPEVALQVLEAIRQAPNDRPTPGPIPRGDRTLVADPEIPGATATLGFQAILDPEGPDATADSAGVTFVMDSWLVTIDVQGGLPAETALSVAVDLATQQGRCLASGSCHDLTVPEGLRIGPGATPDAALLPSFAPSVSTR